MDDFIAYLKKLDIEGAVAALQSLSDAYGNKLEAHLQHSLPTLVNLAPPPLVVSLFARLCSTKSPNWHEDMIKKWDKSIREKIEAKQFTVAAKELGAASLLNGMGDLKYFRSQLFVKSAIALCQFLRLGSVDVLSLGDDSELPLLAPLQYLQLRAEAAKPSDISLQRSVQVWHSIALLMIHLKSPKPSVPNSWIAEAQSYLKESGAFVLSGKPVTVAAPIKILSPEVEWEQLKRAQPNAAKVLSFYLYNFEKNVEE
jgi:hypothetical protein